MVCRRRDGDGSWVSLLLLHGIRIMITSPVTFSRFFHLDRGGRLSRGSESKRTRTFQREEPQWNRKYPISSMSTRINTWRRMGCVCLCCSCVSGRKSDRAEGNPAFFWFCAHKWRDLFNLDYRFSNWAWGCCLSFISVNGWVTFWLHNVCLWVRFLSIFV